MKLTLNGTDFDRASSRLCCERAAIEAVAIVEAPGGGFNPDESPKTLFEGHHFHRLTAGRFDTTHPTLSFPKWTREHYGRTWQDEAYRLKSAISLDAAAALMATSWGRFQIMGFNHGACGYTSIEAFVEAMKDSEAKQLDAFVSFIESQHLADELRDRRWADFARHYNGPDFAENHYDTKMAIAYKQARHALGLDK